MKYLLVLLSAVLIIGCSNPVNTLQESQSNPITNTLSKPKQKKLMYSFRTIVIQNKEVLLDTTIVSANKPSLNVSYTAGEGDITFVCSAVNPFETATTVTWGIETTMTTSDVIGYPTASNSFEETFNTNIIAPGTYSITMQVD